MSDGFKTTFLRETAAYVRADAAIYLIIAIYALCGMLLLHGLQADDRAAYSIYFGMDMVMFGLVMPVAVFIFDLCWSVHRFDRRRRLVFRHVFSPQRLAYFVSGMLIMQSMLVFFGTFTSVKNILPLLHDGFAYDRLHADIDAALHGGVDPWRLIQTVWGTESIRQIVEWNYNFLWFLVCYGALFFVATSPRARKHRTRYVVAFMLVWIVVGNILAGAFLSAGPAFYGLVTGDTLRFAEQLEFLAGREITAVTASYQDYLWNAHVSGQAGLGTGISAFPSVHVALTSLNAYFLCLFSRRLGAVAFCYVGFVELSSVYLAWHYAIDGYAAILVTGLIFAVVSKWLPDGTRWIVPRRHGGAVGAAAFTAS
ncbi:MAG: phosphatase PAP2 family protein [Rhizobiaceae bacterium]|nr:phosphatase PAP2 family protein [Rhizobiaceae bacterium]